MVPSYFIALDVLPLTPNGKIDRKALPAPDSNFVPTEKRALRDETDELLATLWAEVLHCKVSSRADDFFALGGHSLLATQLVSRIRNSFAIETPLREIFDKPILGDFADWLNRQQCGIVLPPLHAQAIDAPLLMSHDQKVFWLRSQLEEYA